MEDTLESKKTGSGIYIKDKSGLWHYKVDIGHIDNAIDDVLKHKPKEATWFWFNDTPAPIFSGDTKETLYIRWNEWRDTFQQNPESLLSQLLNLFKNKGVF